MRIITEDNIDQLLNLSYQSRNIDRLLHIEPGDMETEVKTIVENYKRDMESLVTKTTPPMTQRMARENIEYQDLSPITPSVSPNYPSPDYPSPEITPPGDNSLPQVANLPQDNSLPQVDNLPQDNSLPQVANLPPENIIQPIGSLIDANALPQVDSLSPVDNLSQPNSVPPLSGGSPVFNDTQMYEAFSKLSGENQQQILKLSEPERLAVMSEILRKSSHAEKNVLGGAFEALPVDKKLVALQGGYNSMAKDFGGLVKTVQPITTTVYKPMNMQDILTKQLPLIGVKGGASNVSSETTNKEVKFSDTSDTSSSSSSSGSSSSSSSNIKTITI
jgi:hypothetical protein